MQQGYWRAVIVRVLLASKAAAIGSAVSVLAVEGVSSGAVPVTAAAAALVTLLVCLVFGIPEARQQQQDDRDRDDRDAGICDGPHARRQPPTADGEEVLGWVLFADVDLTDPGAIAHRRWEWLILFGVLDA